jgi:hypothetical protein
MTGARIAAAIAVTGAKGREPGIFR